MVITLDHMEIDGSCQNTLKDGAQKVVEHVKPNWNKEDLKFKIYTDGVTNKLIGVWNNDFNNQILLRIYGENTELYIDRNMEKENMQLFHANNIGTELLASFKNGICYNFIAGTPLATDSMDDEEIWKAVGKQMAVLHNIQIKSKEAFIFPKMRQFIELLPDCFWKNHEERLSAVDITKCYFEREADELESNLTSLGCPVVLNHNDILLYNIIWDESTKTAHFIDYEYAAPNYQAFDIGNHFCEFVGLSLEMDYEKLYPKTDFQLKWIRNYLSCYWDKKEDEIDPQEVDKWRRWANKFALASHLFWGAWALVQAHNSSIDFDYLRYAILRLREYETRKREFLSL